MTYRKVKTFAAVILSIWLLGLCMTVRASSVEETVDEWISNSILRIYQKVKDISGEYRDPFFVPRVLIGPIVTRTLPNREYYESQFSLLLRDSIYLKMAAGLAPIQMNVVDVDVLPKAVESSRLNSSSLLNVTEIAASYTSSEAMRKCVDQLMDVANMVVLGQISLKDNQALTTFTILRMVNGQLYMDRTPISVQTFHSIPDISMTIKKDGVDRMIEFVASTDDDIQKSVTDFIKRFAGTWEKGDVDKVMSYYSKGASAVTLTVNDESSVKLTNVLDRNALELVMVEFFERYRVTDFDFTNPRVYDVKRNSKSVVSCSVDFYADITLANGEIRKLPLLSFYMQLRQEGKNDWKIYFQRIKEVPKYSIQSWGRD